MPASPLDFDNMVQDQLNTYGGQGGRQTGGGYSSRAGFGTQGLASMFRNGGSGYISRSGYGTQGLASMMGAMAQASSGAGRPGASILSLMPGAMQHDVNATQTAEGQRAVAVQQQLAGYEGVLGQVGDLYNTYQPGGTNPVDTRIQSGDALAAQQLSDFDKFAYGEGGIMPSFDQRTDEQASAAARGIGRSTDMAKKEADMSFNWQGATGSQRKDVMSSLDQNTGEQLQSTMTDIYSRANEARAQLGTSLQSIRAGIQGNQLNMHQVGSGLAQFKSTLQQGLLAQIQQGRSDLVALSQEGIENPVSWFAALAPLFEAGNTPNANRARIQLPGGFT